MTRHVRCAVVGHVEWVEFCRVERVPRPGEIAHALESWEEMGGGGGVASVRLATLGAETTLYTALGDDELGRRGSAELERRGVQVAAAWRPPPQRRAFTFVDREGERTITVIGERLGPRGDEPLPWRDLTATDAVYFVSGDAAALRAARAARVVCATARSLPTLREAGVELDALVHSGSDAGERYAPGDLDPPPRLVVTTAGSRGGRWTSADGRTGTWPAAPLPGPVSDAYGAGDSFAAGLTFSLGRGDELGQALAFAARSAAEALTLRGAYGGSAY
jgi:ribokinase